MKEAEHFADGKKLAARLRDEVGLSISYASELASNKRQPSLRLAAEIETKIGIPASAWTRRPAEQGQAA